jgi:hypothetical protein
MQVPNSILNAATGIPEATFASLKSRYPLVTAPGTGGEECLARCNLTFAAVHFLHPLLPFATEYTLLPLILHRPPLHYTRFLKSAVLQWRRCSFDVQQQTSIPQPLQGVQNSPQLSALFVRCIPFSTSPHHHQGNSPSLWCRICRSCPYIHIARPKFARPLLNVPVCCRRTS